MQLLDFHHVSFTVADIARSVAFYRDILGMEVLSEREVENDYIAKIVAYSPLKMKIVFLVGGGEKLELIQYIAPEGKPIDTNNYNPGVGHIAFVVDDIHAWHKWLLEHGVKTRSEPVRILNGPHKGGYSMYVYDPDGVSVELMQLAPTS